MESRESQRDKRIRDVLYDRPSGGGDSPTASAMRAREEIQGIEAERAANLEREKIVGSTRQQQMATMKQAAILGASGMTASDVSVVSPLAQQAAAMNPQTQAILQKYGVKPGPKTTVSTTQTSGPNIRTTNTTNNNVRNEIKIVQPQIPMRQQQIAVAGQGKTGNLDKFKAWLDSSFAKQANEYEVQQKEYRKREWNLARNSSKLFQKLSESTKSLGEKMDPRSMGNTFGGQLKTLLFLFLATTIDKWWNPLMKKIASFEAGFRAVFGIPMNADLEKSGAGGLSFVNKIKEFIGIDVRTEKGKRTSLLGGIREVFTDGITRLIDTLKLFVEDRRIALQKINLPDFKMPNADFNPLGKMINAAFKGVMAPATEYLGNIFRALMGGSSAVTQKAARNIESVSKDSFLRDHGGRYFTSESTDLMGNLKDDSTYGMSKMLTNYLTTNDNVLRTGSLMTGLKMLERNSQTSGGAVINPELLARLGIGPDTVSKMIESGQAQYVPYKLISVSKSEAESEGYSRGSWGSYVGNELLDNLTFGLWGWATGKTAKGVGKLAGKRLGRGLIGKGVKLLSKAGPIGAAAGALWSLGAGTYDYLKANEGNSDTVVKAVPESDPRPGTPIKLLKITPEGFNTIKQQNGIKEFDPTDRNFRTWLEGQERNQKAIMGVRKNLVYENQAGMEALDMGHTMEAAYDAKLAEIRNRPGPWKGFSDHMSGAAASVTQWFGSKINVLASGVSGNPTYERRNTIYNLYQTLKSALDEKRPDLPEDKREVYARLMAAQAMHESSGNYPGGISKLAYDANNYGGVVATKGRPVYYHDNGTISKWSKFNDMQDWANYQVGLLNGSRYKIFDANPSDYVSVLKQGGYFGDGDESDYATAVQKHLGNVNSVMGSYQYTSFEPTNYMSAITPPPSGATSLGADLSNNNIKGCPPESIESEKLRKIIAQRNTGKFRSRNKDGTWTWHLLGKNAYKSLCTAGPSTFYEAAGYYDLRNSWWNTGSAYTATFTRIGEAYPNLKKIWNGSLGQLDSMGPSQLRPGDIGVLFGRHKDGSPSSHGMMWDGKYWVSDTVQSHGACYSSGRLGNQSAQIWRMADFWPDDFGGGDEGSLGTTWLDSNGEVYTGTFMGEYGNEAGAVIGSIGAATNRMAQNMLGKGQVIAGYNPAALSASQRATINWMKRNGATEDESGIYIYDEVSNTRAYLDPNSGISKTGNIERSNIKLIGHVGENGTIDRFEADQEAIDAYKDRAIGKLLNIKISEGKTPESKVVDIFLGNFYDIQGFSERVKKYIKYIKLVLYEVLADGTGITSVLCPRIPILDENGIPIRVEGKSALSNNDQIAKETTTYTESCGCKHRIGWTYLFKKAGFRYKRIMSDLHETVSDFHPYLHGELKIDITPEAMRRINAIMAYIRGELENPGESLKWMNENKGLSEEDVNKFKNIQDKILEVGRANIREALGVTDTKIDQSISDWKAGKNKDNYVTYTEDNGTKYVIDSTLGIKVAQTPEGGGEMVALEKEKINEQTGEDYTKYLRQADIAKGNWQGDFESLYKSYMEDDTPGLSDSEVKKEFIRRMSGREGKTVKVKGREWRTFIDDRGNIRYKRDVEADKVAEEVGEYIEKAKRVLGVTDVDEIRKAFSKGLTGEQFARITGSTAPLWQGTLPGQQTIDWNDNHSISRYYQDFGEDISEVLKGSKTHIGLQKSWLRENSDSRKLAEALVAKYNKTGDTENLYESNGTLIYQDGAGMVHAVGKVTENESGFKTATSYDNTEEGAELYADANEAFANLNLGTDVGQTFLKSELAAKYGAVPIGKGLMMIEHGNHRLVFDPNKVGRHAEISDIINSEGASFYRNARDTDDETQNQIADEIFGDNSGWSKISLKLGRMPNWPGTNIDLSPEVLDSEAGAKNLMEMAMTKSLRNWENSDEAQKQHRFNEAYEEASKNLTLERFNKIESGSIDKQMEGHAGNIEDYTKRSADYLEIIAGAVVKKGSNDEERLSLLRQQRLPSTQLELRTHLGPITREDVDKVTEEVKKNSKETFVSLLTEEIKNLVEKYKDNKLPDSIIFQEAKRNILNKEGMQNSKGKFFEFGGFAVNTVAEANRRLDEKIAAETRDRANNIKDEKLNIKDKKEIQRTEAEVLKAETELTKTETKNQVTFLNATEKLDQSAETIKQLAPMWEDFLQTHNNPWWQGPGFTGDQIINNNAGSDVKIQVDIHGGPDRNLGSFINNYDYSNSTNGGH